MIVVVFDVVVCVLSLCVYMVVFDEMLVLFVVGLIVINVEMLCVFGYLVEMGWFGVDFDV